MNKKVILSFLLVLIISVTSVLSASAATVGFNLTKDYFSTSTAKISVGSTKKLDVKIFMSGNNDKNISYTIFTGNHNEYTSGTVNTSTRFLETTLTNIPAGDYYMTVYCGAKNSQTVNCSANGGLGNY